MCTFYVEFWEVVASKCCLSSIITYFAADYCFNYAGRFLKIQLWRSGRLRGALQTSIAKMLDFEL